MIRTQTERGAATQDGSDAATEGQAAANELRYEFTTKFFTGRATNPEDKSSGSLVLSVVTGPDGQALFEWREEGDLHRVETFESHDGEYRLRSWRTGSQAFVVRPAVGVFSPGSATAEFGRQEPRFSSVNLEVLPAADERSGCRISTLNITYKFSRGDRVMEEQRQSCWIVERSVPAWVRTELVTKSSSVVEARVEAEILLKAHGVPPRTTQ